MAKTKTKSHSKSTSKDILHSTDGRVKTTKKPQRSIEDLLTEAASLLEQSQPDSALPLVEEALQRLEAERQDGIEDIDVLLQQAAQGHPTLPTALTLGADIDLALGDANSARKRFTQATEIDPDGALVSAEPWLWLAQLCEEGGRESIEFFEKGVEVLRNEIDVLQDAVPEDDEEGAKILDEKKAKLADALCGMAEVYMTDLSWEVDAEVRCENYVTEAVAVCPERLSATVLQTLASVRISQERVEEARGALNRSMEIWKDLPATENDGRPDFAARISLSRLLMEVEAEPDALGVLEGLVKEDDQSVECWYLGGWCQLLISQKEGMDGDILAKMQEQAMQWLQTCLKLYQQQDYEDKKLRDHALELKHTLSKDLGIDVDDDEAWEDEDGSEEEDEMDPEDVEIEIDLNGHEVEDQDVEMT